ncbi:MAG: cation diffusion facilitator family transporter [Gammaproteobacteria bacterium]
MASLLDSAMDGLASLLNLFAVRYALTPPDNEHRFGHGKAEPIASLCQAIIIAASAILLAKHAFNAMTVPQVIEAPSLGAGIMIFSLFSTVGLLLFQRYVVRHTQSTAIQADALHYLGDLITQSAALVIMILAHWGWYGADTYIALAIGGYVFSSAWGIARDSFHILMDHELSSDTRARVERLVRAHPKVRGLHDMKTRRSGQTLFIQLHLELDDHISLIQAHHISDEVELSLLNAFPRAEVLIHQDPVSQYRRDPLPQDPSNP